MFRVCYFVMFLVNKMSATIYDSMKALNNLCSNNLHI